MRLAQATAIAERVKAQLAPHCDRIEIAGSIRRRKQEVGDIEIVAIPKPYDVGLFAYGIAQIVEQWPKVRGELPCRYTQRILPDGIALDLSATDLGSRALDNLPAKNLVGIPWRVAFALQADGEGGAEQPDARQPRGRERRQQAESVPVCAARAWQRARATL